MKGTAGIWGRLVQAVVVVLILLIGAGLVWSKSERWFGRAPTADQHAAFAKKIKAVRAEQKWKASHDFRPRLTREMLQQSARLGCAALVANQRPAGDFNYEYNYLTRTQNPDNNHVRQAGALWGLSLCYGFEPNEKTRSAIERGLEFFGRHSTLDRDGALTLRYPDQRLVGTGAVALLSLAIVDYLRVAEGVAPTRRQQLEKMLDGYLMFLKKRQFAAGNFSMGLIRIGDFEIGRSSGYFDGESLLAMCKAAKYLGRRDLLPLIQKAAARMAPKYTVDAWAKTADSDQTKTFYQWGTMSFWEYQDADWPGSEVYRDTALAMAWWMINTHRLSSRTRNTAYAYEGLVHAYLIAEREQNHRAAASLRQAIDRGLYELTKLQVEGPLAAQNSFLRQHRTTDPLAVGGVLNEKNRPELRIDVTQHQMHAVLLALEHIYRETAVEQ